MSTTVMSWSHLEQGTRPLSTTSGLHLEEAVITDFLVASWGPRSLLVCTVVDAGFHVTSFSMLAFSCPGRFQVLTLEQDPGWAP